jgi:hypothetical protein
MRITCDRCGKPQLSETYTPQRDMLMRDIIKLMRHAGCGRSAWQGGAAHRHRGC